MSKQAHSGFSDLSLGPLFKCHFIEGVSSEYSM